MSVAIELGVDASGAPASIDLQELIATRLLVQGNSGSGKSHLLRRILEESAGWVQQVVIDPEGDFVSLSEIHDHLVIEAADHTTAELASIAQRVRSHRVSVVLNLEGLEVEGQLRCASEFLNALFGAPREHWFPALVVVDEAQLFAPAAGGETPDEARRLSLAAMTNLMCRGRKRGLAGVIATQRLAKLAKNVAAEASNFLMGRTFLDIDMLRAADLLGMERRQAEQIRDLERGQFMALGPALCRRPKLIRIGAVRTGSRGGAPALAPLPERSAESARDLLFTGIEPELPLSPPPPPAPRATLGEMLDKVEQAVTRPTSPSESAEPARTEEEVAAIIDAALAEIVEDPDAAFQTSAVSYQDFVARCRMRGLRKAPLALVEFERRLAMARAGLFSAELADPDWAPAIEAADEVPADMIGIFLRIARAARESEPCPADEELAQVYGTRSTGRLKRLLGYMDTKGIVVFRTDMRKRRSAAIPRLGWTTAVESAPQACS